MAWSFAKLETWKYRKLLQRRFWKPSRILDHEFSILDPGHSRWTSITDEDGRQRQVPESAYCVLHQDGIITGILIPKDEFPDVFEAVILLHQAQ
jgi:protein associated with RNAse G/E